MQAAQHQAGERQIGGQFISAAGHLQAALELFGPAAGAAARSEVVMLQPGQLTIGRREIRVQRCRAFQQQFGLWEVGGHGRAPQFAALKKQLIGAEAARPAVARAPVALAIDGLHQRGDDPAHDLVLESEELVVRTIEVVGPDHRLVLGLDQLRANAHLPRVPSQAALNHEAHTGCVADSTRVACTLTENHRRFATDDKHLGVVRQAGGDVFGKAPRQHVQPGALTDIDERQHHDGWPVGYRRRRTLRRLGGNLRVTHRHLEHKASPGHCLKQALVSVTQGSADVADALGDGFVGGHTAAPHRRQFIPGNHPLGVLREQAQHLEGLGPEFDRAVLPQQLRRLRVEHEVVEGQSSASV